MYLLQNLLKSKIIPWPKFLGGPWINLIRDQDLWLRVRCRPECRKQGSSAAERSVVLVEKHTEHRVVLPSPEHWFLCWEGCDFSLQQGFYT